MTTELVGPLPTIRFYDGTKQAYDVPRDTMDPRFAACTYHHPACDCREAELAEHISELRGELKGITKAVREVLRGHPIWVYEDGPNGPREVGCMCTGCQIVRAAWVLPHSEADSGARDEVDGVDPDSADAGTRWKVCTDHAQTKCVGAETRDRGDYHEHLTYSDGTLAKPINWNEAPF